MNIQVIAKYLDGKMVTGSTLNFGSGEMFKLTTDEVEDLIIPIRMLKAVFFLKDEKAKGTIQARFGKKILVEFSDGEKILGTTVDYRENVSRFFVFPLDKESNNDRILVNVHAADSIKIMGATYGVENAPAVSDGRKPTKGHIENAVYKTLYAIATDLAKPGIKVDDSFLLDKKILLGNKIGSLIAQYEEEFGKEERQKLLDRKLKDVEMAMGGPCHESVRDLIRSLYEDQHFGDGCESE